MHIVIRVMTFYLAAKHLIMRQDQGKAVIGEKEEEIIFDHTQVAFDDNEGPQLQGLAAHEKEKSKTGNNTKGRTKHQQSPHLGSLPVPSEKEEVKETERTRSKGRGATAEKRKRPAAPQKSARINTAIMGANKKTIFQESSSDEGEELEEGGGDEEGVGLTNEQLSSRVNSTASTRDMGDGNMLIVSSQNSVKKKRKIDGKMKGGVTEVKGDMDVDMDKTISRLSVVKEDVDDSGLSINVKDQATERIALQNTSADLTHTAHRTLDENYNLQNISLLSEVSSCLLQRGNQGECSKVGQLSESFYENGQVMDSYDINDAILHMR